nr:DUF6348 family protein [Streptomyces sp. SID3343]
MPAALLARLGEYSPDWRAGRDGLVGPGSTGVRLVAHGEGRYGHIDIGFVLNRDKANAPVLLDCVVVPPGDPVEAVGVAARIWAGSTLPPILELFARRGEYGAHVGLHDFGGLPGRHVIYGPVFGWGIGVGSTELMEWIAARPLLAEIGDLVAPAVQGPLDLVKVVVGGPAGAEVVEVRVGERAVPEAEHRLLSRGWPRPAGAFFSRSVMLVLDAGRQDG